MPFSFDIDLRDTGNEGPLLHLGLWRQDDEPLGICDGCWCHREAIYRARKAIEAAQMFKQKS